MNLVYLSLQASNESVGLLFALGIYNNRSNDLACLGLAKMGHVTMIFP